jgi:two-component system response regulator YesN
MLRLVIADDEKIIRESISRLVDWQSIGIQVAAICCTGLEAYNAIVDIAPDIVLTDINMPGLSGLALIRRIQEISSSIQFVILTGYGDYAFTKDAMELGIRHYLLKPCNEKEITETMEQVKRECLIQKMRQDQRVEDVEMLRSLQESIVSNLAQECLRRAPDFAAIAGRYEQFLNFYTVGCELCQWHGDAAAREACLSAFETFHEKRAPGIPYYCLRADDALLVGFQSYDYDYTAMDAALQGAFEGKAGYVRRSFASLNALLPVLHEWISQCSTVQMGRGGRVIERGGSDWPQTEQCELPLPAASREDPVKRLTELTLEHLEDDDLSLKKLAQEKLYMNDDYLGRIFAKRTGQKFSAFVAQARVDRAKQLFAKGTSCVNDVAQAVGCGNNPQYFSQLFKKVAGMTPTDYLHTLR